MSFSSTVLVWKIEIISLLNERQVIKEALLILKCWFASASIRSFDFSIAPLWIRVEGIPLTKNYPHVTRRALQNLGDVITFDEASLLDDPKEFVRAKVKISLDKPLIPGYFYEYQGQSIG